MTNTIRMGLIVAVSVLATSAVWWGRTRSRPKPAPTEETTTSSVGAELVELRAELADLQRRQQQAPRVQPSTAPETPSAPAPTRTLEEQIALEAKAAADDAAALNQQLDSESIDVAWSGETAAQIKAAFRTHLPNANVVETRCGRTICRVVVHHAEGDDTMRAPIDLISAPPFNHGNYLWHQPTTLTVFLFREGVQPTAQARL